MENYIVLGDKRIELREELAASLTAILQSVAGEKNKETDPFARAACGDRYYYINHGGATREDTEYGNSDDYECYRAANYCTDEELLKQRALHETLNRLLWRYSEQHGGDREWGPVEVDHHSIYHDKLNNKWRVATTAVSRYLGNVYFRDHQTALKAIEEIVEPFVRDHPEFRW